MWLYHKVRVSYQFYNVKAYIMHLYTILTINILDFVQISTVKSKIYLTISLLVIVKK